MSGADVCVHRLRLVAERGVGVHALRARVEDALRISSKPPALAHRFVLLRRLRLRLPREASAQSLALQLEREWRVLEAQAEAIATASADAPAVWAVDEVQARLSLLRRWLQGQPSEAWFWQRLLPSAAAALPLARNLVALLFEPFDNASAAPALERALQARLWREALPSIEAAGHGPALFAALTAPQRAAPHRLHAWRREPPESTPDPVAGPVSAMPALSAAQAAPLPTAPLGGASDRDVDLPPSRVADSAVAAQAMPRHLADTGTRVERQGGWPTQLARNRPLGTDPLRPAVVPAMPAVPPAHAEPSFGARATEWAGLWFLLPVLLRQGLAQQPDPAPLFAAVLGKAAARHGLDAAAREWIDRVARHAKLDDARSMALQDTAQAWWRVARIACLRQARLPLRRLLHRPGRVWLAPHRVDVSLPLHQADIRIRRAGFDIDPGYVPWLDGVFHFHYA